MEFSSVHNCPHSHSPLNDVNGNFDMFESSRGCYISDGYILTSSDEANEKIGSFVEGMGRVLIGIPLFFVNSLIAVGSLLYRGASATVEGSVSAAKAGAYHAHKAGHILTHSEDKVWDEDVWKAKRKTDFVKELLTVSNKDEIGQVTAAKGLITGITDNDTSNITTAKELLGINYLSDLDRKDLNEVAGNLLDNIGSMPKVSIVEANRLIVSTLGAMNRDELDTWLREEQNPRSHLVRIARRFLVQSNAKAKERANPTNVDSSSKIHVKEISDGADDEQIALLSDQRRSSEDSVSESGNDRIQLNPQPDIDISDIPLGTDEARVLAILKKAIESEKIVRLQQKLNSGMTLQNVDNAVTVLMYKLDSIPEISDEYAKKVIASVLSTMNKTELNAWLQTQDQQSPLVQIAQRFLARCTKGVNDKFSVNEAGILCMLRNAIEAERAMNLKQNLAALVTNDDLSQLNVNVAVNVLMYELDKMPLAPNIDDTLLSREKLVAQLQTIPQTHLVAITLKFLAESSRGNSTKPLNANEWTIVSALTGGIAAKQKMDAKQNQRELAEDGKQLLKLRVEYKSLYDQKYQEKCKHFTQKNNAFRLPQNEENLKKVVEDSLYYDQELQQKSAGVEEASNDLDEKNRANIERQSQLKIAENIESLSFFAWNKLSHADGITYLDGQTKHEFLPGYNNVTVHGLTAGVDFGLKKLIPGEPNAFAGVKVGITYTDNYFSDDENYLGHVTGQWNIVGTLLARAGWDGMYGVAGNANLTRSFRARYAEWGTEHKRNVHQFTDKGRAEANNNEQYGHHYDSQVNKFKDDPGFKPFLSRRARLGMEESYLDYEDWDEVTRIDQEKLNFDATEKKKEGDMQVQNSLALTSTAYSKEQLASYAVEPSQKIKDQIKKDKFHMRESASYAVETSKEVKKDINNIREDFREKAKEKIDELKRQRNRVIEDVELELNIIKEKCIEKIEAYWQAELNSVSKENKEAAERNYQLQLNLVKAQFSELENQINLLKINKRELKEHRIARLNNVQLVLNRLDALVGNDQLSEKTKPLIAELCILLAEKVDEENEVAPSKHAGLRYEMIGYDGETWISKLIFDLDYRKNETLHARQHRIDVAIKDKESALRIKELKLDLLFKLRRLNSQDDPEAQELVAIYEFKIVCADKQSEIQKINLNRNMDIAALKREYAKQIAQVHEEASQQKPSVAAKKEKLHSNQVTDSKRHSSIFDSGMDFDSVNIMDQPDEKSAEESDEDYLSRTAPTKAAEETLKRVIEELEQKRDSAIREKRKVALLAAADIELDINLAALKVKGGDQVQDKETEFRKEGAIKKHRIENQFEVQKLKQQNALKLAATERKWALESAQLEYKQAAEIRRAELEIKLATLNVKIAIAKREAERITNNARKKELERTARELKYELEGVEKEWVRNEVKIEAHIRDSDPRIMKLAGRFADFKGSILGLDAIVQRTLSNTANKTLEATLKELSDHALLKVTELSDAQAKDLAQAERKRDIEFAEFDKKHADDIIKTEHDLKKGELKAEKKSLLLAKKDQEASKVQAKIDALKNQFKIDELRRQRDYEIETLTDDEILGMEWSKDEKALIDEYGPTLWLMKNCETKTKPLEEKLQQADPWAQVIDYINESARGEYQKLEQLANSKDPVEAEKYKVGLASYKLAVQQLIKLLPLQSQTAVEQREQLIKDLRFEHLFKPEQRKVISYSSEDEKTAQKICAEFDLATFNLGIECDRNLDNICYKLALIKSQKQFDSKEEALGRELKKELKKEFREELEKELGQALFKHLQYQNEAANEHFEKLREINARVYAAPKGQEELYQERIEKLTQAEQKKKDDEQAWAKEYLSWIPVQNQVPISFTNTDVEHNGAYLADYYTWSVYGSGAGDGATDDLGGLSGALELSGKRRYTNLTREKFTFLCDMLGNIYKPLEETKGIARLLNEQLNSEPPKTRTEKLRSWWSPQEKPVSIKDIIISGWQENNLFSYKPTIASKKPTSVTYANGVTRSGYSVDKSYFTVENALRCVNQDMASIIYLQYKMGLKDKSLRKGAQESLEILQKRYGAHNMHELVRHMAYFIAHLRVLSGHGGDYNAMNPTQVAVDKKPTAEIIELQGKIKAAETMLFERVQVEKKEYWRECGVEESQIVSVTLRQGILKGKVGVKLGPIGSYVTGSFKVEHFRRRHVMETRDSDYFDITGAWGYLAGLAGGIGLGPSTLQDTIKDAWNNTFSDGDLSQNGSPPDIGINSSVEQSKTFRFHWLRRFEALYKELGYSMKWFPTYVRPVITKETRTGFEASVPLDKIMGVPVHPNLGFSTSTFETESTNEKWFSESHQHPLMHYMHANHTDDIDRNTGKILRKDCFWATSITTQRAFFAGMSENHGKQQWELTHKKTPVLNELHVREVEFRRNSLLDPALFRDFQRAKAHYLRVTKYYDVLHNSQKRIAEVKSEVNKLKIKNADLNKRLNAIRQKQIDQEAELAQVRKKLQSIASEGNLEMALIEIELSGDSGHNRNLAARERQIEDLKKVIKARKEIIEKAEQKMEARQKKIVVLEENAVSLEKKIRNTLTEANMFFKEKNGDPKCAMKEFAHNHCVDSLNAMYHAYFPQDYSLLQNSPLYSASTVVVNGERKETYNKKALLKTAMSGKKGVTPLKKFVREDVNYYNDPASYYNNLHDASNYFK